ncbi:hypothetical protein K6V72_17315 [Ralstonia insidiosa]|uniref:7TM-DISM receptor extracellular domain-containing protein n=1 Tax=Ralstonia insidiosa TaxID=190721 RepID=A0A192A4H1_9RALS|nr:7TM-DISM domain-containing protein [Ralstonia insidiosa]ANJ75182.1 hypothetical protein A9Y76_21910 [Ralstonia insidiosa]KAB0468084.1 hypothetical protein F7R11_22855 [Ralstonia insidiosa]MBY4910776.1 hypothetical protein [Ralstonia insidiosa]
MLEYTTGRRDLEAAMAKPNWQHVPGGNLNLGYTAPSVWLRGSPYNCSAHAITRKVQQLASLGDLAELTKLCS